MSRRPARRLVRFGLAALFALAPLAACNDPFIDEAAAATPAPLETVTVRIKTGTKVHSYRAEVARTPEQQSRGLMYRTTMPRDAGMIFLFPEPRMASFWMANTYVPLDIIFISAEGRVVNVGEGVPLSTATVESTGLASTVLELNRGEAARIGLKPGDRISWASR
ncbi:MAG: DUF192 domain-containing protein [Sphingomonadaceae bacterium]|nr:DUF192 domain-containing protein [Sphingomonadaceae bacterium]